MLPARSLNVASIAGVWQLSIGLVATLWQICLKFRIPHAPKMYSAPWPDTAELRLRGAIHAAKLSLYKFIFT